MANSLLKLTVESSEYDAKLKKAAEGIRHLADVAHKGGGELTGLEKAEIDYIRALGEMETKSRTAAGQTRELESAFKELTVIYNQLNEVEKADEGGKALAASLETLKQRAQDAKAQMDAASQSLQTNASAGQEDSSALAMLADKFTINIDAIKLFNAGLSVAERVLGVAKDAFFASEATVDEWGRVMQSSQSLYEGFLNAINNGDISGFLSRMDEIVQAARAAYNELDTLGTMKTIQAPKMSAQQTENERFRMMIQTGRYIAPIDGRKASMKDGQLLTPAQIKTLERQLQNGMHNVVKLVGNEVKQTGKAIDAYYNSIAKQNGMSLQEFKKGTSSWDEFSKKMQGYQQYQKWRQENSFTDMYGNRQVREGNPYQEFKKWGTFRVDKMGENSFNDLVRLIQQRDQQAGQAYGMQSQAYRTMNRAEGVTVSKLMGRSGSVGGSKNTKAEQTELQQNQTKINALTQEYVKLGDDVTEAARNRQEDIRKEIALLEERNNLLAVRAEQAKGKLLNDIPGVSMEIGGGVVTKSMQATMDNVMPKGGLQLDEKAMKAVTKQITDQNNKKIKDSEKNEVSISKGMSSVAGGVSQMVGGLEQLGVEIPQGLKDVLGGIQAIAAILTGISALISIITAIQGTKAVPVIGFLAARGGIVPKAAGGRFIGGNSYSGDNIFAGNAWVNSGELVLNKAQQSTLASQLEGGGMQGMKLSAVISGEQIRLVLNNNGRRTGKGEYVQTNFR